MSAAAAQAIELANPAAARDVSPLAAPHPAPCRGGRTTLVAHPALDAFAGILKRPKADLVRIAAALTAAKRLPPLAHLDADALAVFMAVVILGTGEGAEVGIADAAAAVSLESLACFPDQGAETVAAPANEFAFSCAFGRLLIDHPSMAECTSVSIGLDYTPVPRMHATFLIADGMAFYSGSAPTWLSEMGAMAGWCVTLNAGPLRRLGALVDARAPIPHDEGNC